MSAIVRYKQGEVPPITEEMLVELKASENRKIDFSDIPYDETFFNRAVPNPFYKPVKVQATVRIDADIMAWLKKQGKGYQTKMNTILREAMLRSL